MRINVAVTLIGQLPPFVNDGGQSLCNAFLIESFICIDYENTLRLQPC